MKRISKRFCVILVCMLLLACNALPVIAAPPAAPTDLYLSSPATTIAGLMWTNVANETGYYLYRKGPGESVFTLIHSTSADVCNYIDGPLTPGSTYYYYVSAVNADGSSDSVAIPVVTPAAAVPAAPTNLHTTAVLSSSVALAWTDVATNETRYFVERRASAEVSWTEIHSALADLNNYTDTTVNPSTTYYYRIYCTNTSGYSDNSNEIMVAVPAASSGIPPAPTNLHTTAVSATAVSLAWTNNATDATFYYVARRRSTETGSTPLTSLAASAISYTDSTVVPGTTYYYEVYCANTAGTSYATPELMVEVPALTPPAAPTSLHLVSSTSTEAVIGWTDNASDESMYVIERKGPGATSFSFLASGAVDLEQYTDSAATPGDVYIYRVYCSNTAGMSGYSNELNVTIPDIGTPPVYVSTVVSYYLNSSTFYVNGSARTMDVAPLATEGRILLPMRFVVEPLGGTAVWDGKATVNFNGHTIILWLNNNTALVDGVSKMIDDTNPAVTPLAVDGRILLPLRFIGESTGCTADWYGATSEARVVYTP